MAKSRNKTASSPKTASASSSPWKMVASINTVPKKSITASTAPKGRGKPISTTKKAKTIGGPADKVGSTDSSRRKILAGISKPYRKNSKNKQHKKDFNAFLKRLKGRDVTLAESDELAEPGEPGEISFNNAIGNVDEEWEVEEILDSGLIDGEVHFLVLWKGHLLESSTWESQAALDNSKDAINDFYTAFPRKARAPDRKGKGPDDEPVIGTQQRNIEAIEEN